MKIRKNQLGFSPFELVVLVAVAAMIGLAGYYVYNNHKNQNNGATVITTHSATAISTQSSSASVASAPSDINSTSDLDKAAATLDQTDPSTSNSSDSAVLDSNSNNF